MPAGNEQLGAREIDAKQAKIEAQSKAKESPDALKKKLNDYRSTLVTAVDSAQSELATAFSLKLKSKEAKEYLSSAAERVKTFLLRIAQDGERISAAKGVDGKTVDVKTQQPALSDIDIAKANLQAELVEQTQEIENFRKIEQVTEKVVKAEKKNKELDDQAEVNNFGEIQKGKTALLKDFDTFLGELPEGTLASSLDFKTPLVERIKALHEMLTSQIPILTALVEARRSFSTFDADTEVLNKFVQLAEKDSTRENLTLAREKRAQIDYLVLSNKIFGQDMHVSEGPYAGNLYNKLWSEVARASEAKLTDADDKIKVIEGKLEKKDSEAFQKEAEKIIPEIKKNWDEMVEPNLKFSQRNDLGNEAEGKDFLKNEDFLMKTVLTVTVLTNPFLSEDKKASLKPEQLVALADFSKRAENTRTEIEKNRLLRTGNEEFKKENLQEYVVFVPMQLANSDQLDSLYTFTPAYEKLAEPKKSQVRIAAIDIANKLIEKTKADTEKAKSEIIKLNSSPKELKERLGKEGDRYFEMLEKLKVGNYKAALEAGQAYLVATDNLPPKEKATHEPFRIDAVEKKNMMEQGQAYFEGMNKFRGGDIEEGSKLLLAFLKDAEKLSSENKQLQEANIEMAQEALKTIAEKKLKILDSVFRDLIEFRQQKNLKVYLMTLRPDENQESEAIKRQLEALRENIRQGKVLDFEGEVDSLRMKIAESNQKYFQKQAESLAAKNLLFDQDIQKFAAQINKSPEELKIIGAGMGIDAFAALLKSPPDQQAKLLNEYQQKSIAVRMTELYRSMIDIDGKNGDKKDAAEKVLHSFAKEVYDDRQYGLAKHYLDKILEKDYAEGKKRVDRSEIRKKVLENKEMVEEIKKGAKLHYEMMIKKHPELSGTNLLSKFEQQLLEEKIENETKRAIRGRMIEDNSMETLSNPSLAMADDIENHLDFHWYDPRTYSAEDKDAVEDFATSFAWDLVSSGGIGFGAGSAGQAVMKGIMKAAMKKGVSRMAIVALERGGVAALKNKVVLKELVKYGVIKTGATAVSVAVEGGVMFGLGAIMGGEEGVHHLSWAGLGESIAKAAAFRVIGASGGKMFGKMLNKGGSSAIVGRMLMENASAVAGIGIEVLSLYMHDETDQIDSAFLARSYFMNLATAYGTHVAHEVGGSEGSGTKRLKEGKNKDFELRREENLKKLKEAGIENPRQIKTFQVERGTNVTIINGVRVENFDPAVLPPEFQTRVNRLQRRDVLKADRITNAAKRENLVINLRAANRKIELMEKRGEKTGERWERLQEEKLRYEKTLRDLDTFERARAELLVEAKVIYRTNEKGQRVAENLFDLFKGKNYAYSPEMIELINSPERVMKEGPIIVKHGGDEIVVVTCNEKGEVILMFGDIGNMGPTNDFALRVENSNINMVDFFLADFSKLIKEAFPPGKPIDEAAQKAFFEKGKVLREQYFDIQNEAQLKALETKLKVKFVGGYEAYAKAKHNSEVLINIRQNYRKLINENILKNPARKAEINRKVEEAQARGEMPEALQKITDEAVAGYLNEEMAKLPQVEGKSLTEILNNDALLESMNKAGVFEGLFYNLPGHAHGFDFAAFKEILKKPAEARTSEDLVLLNYVLRNLKVEGIPALEGLKPETVAGLKTALTDIHLEPGVMMDSQWAGMKVPPGKKFEVPDFYWSVNHHLESGLKKAKAAKGKAEVFGIDESVFDAQGKPIDQSEDSQAVQKEAQKDKKAEVIKATLDLITKSEQELALLMQKYEKAKGKLTDAERVVLEKEIQETKQKLDDLAAKLNEVKFNDAETKAYSRKYVEEGYQVWGPREKIPQAYRMLLSYKLDLSFAGAINGQEGYATTDAIMTKVVEAVKAEFGELVPDSIRVVRMGGGEIKVIFIDSKPFADAIYGKDGHSPENVPHGLEAKVLEQVNARIKKLAENLNNNVVAKDLSGAAFADAIGRDIGARSRGTAVEGGKGKGESPESARRRTEEPVGKRVGQLTVDREVMLSGKDLMAYVNSLPKPPTYPSIQGQYYRLNSRRTEAARNPLYRSKVSTHQDVPEELWSVKPDREKGITREMAWEMSQENAKNVRGWIGEDSAIHYNLDYLNSKEAGLIDPRFIAVEKNGQLMFQEVKPGTREPVSGKEPLSIMDYEGAVRGTDYARKLTSELVDIRTHEVIHRGAEFIFEGHENELIDLFASSKSQSAADGEVQVGKIIYEFRDAKGNIIEPNKIDVQELVAMIGEKASKVKRDENGSPLEGVKIEWNGREVTVSPEQIKLLEKTFENRLKERLASEPKIEGSKADNFTFRRARRMDTYLIKENPALAFAGREPAPSVAVDMRGQRVDVVGKGTSLVEAIRLRRQQAAYNAFETVLQSELTTARDDAPPSSGVRRRTESQIGSVDRPAHRTLADIIQIARTGDMKALESYFAHNPQNYVTIEGARYILENYHKIVGEVVELYLSDPKPPSKLIALERTGKLNPLQRFVVNRLGTEVVEINSVLNRQPRSLDNITELAAKIKRGEIDLNPITLQVLSNTDIGIDALAQRFFPRRAQGVPYAREINLLIEHGKTLSIKAKKLILRAGIKPEIIAEFAQLKSTDPLAQQLKNALEIFAKHDDIGTEMQSKIWQKALKGEINPRSLTFLLSEDSGVISTNRKIELLDLPKDISLDQNPLVKARDALYWHGKNLSLKQRADIMEGKIDSRIVDILGKDKQVYGRDASQLLTKSEVDVLLNGNYREDIPVLDILSANIDNPDLNLGLLREILENKPLEINGGQDKFYKGVSYGSGGLAEAYEGVYWDQKTNKLEPIAVKKLHEPGTESAKREIEGNARVLEAENSGMDMTNVMKIKAISDDHSIILMERVTANQDGQRRHSNLEDFAKNPTSNAKDVFDGLVDQARANFKLQEVRLPTKQGESPVNPADAGLFDPDMKPENMAMTDGRAWKKLDHGSVVTGKNIRDAEPIRFDMNHDFIAENYPIDEYQLIASDGSIIPGESKPGFQYIGQIPKGIGVSPYYWSGEIYARIKEDPNYPVWKINAYSIGAQAWYLATGKHIMRRAEWQPMIVDGQDRGHWVPKDLVETTLDSFDNSHLKLTENQQARLKNLSLRLMDANNFTTITEAMLEISGIIANKQ